MLMTAYVSTSTAGLRTVSHSTARSAVAWSACMNDAALFHLRDNCKICARHQRPEVRYCLPRAQNVPELTWYRFGHLLTYRPPLLQGSSTRHLGSVALAMADVPVAAILGATIDRLPGRISSELLRLQAYKCGSNAVPNAKCPYQAQPPAQPSGPVSVAASGSSGPGVHPGLSSSDDVQHATFSLIYVRMLEVQCVVATKRSVSRNRAPLAACICKHLVGSCEGACSTGSSQREPCFRTTQVDIMLAMQELRLEVHSTTAVFALPHGAALRAGLSTQVQLRLLLVSHARGHHFSKLAHIKPRPALITDETR